MTLELAPLKRFCSGPPVYGLNVPAERYVDSGTRFLRTTDIGPDGTLNSASGVYLDPNDIPPDYLLRNGDLLLSRSGTLGRALCVQTDGETMTHAGYLVRFRPGPESFARYLWYCAQSQLMQDAIGADAIESTIGNFNAEKYANVRLPLWPPDEQRAIADYLDRETARIDALIAAKQRMSRLTEARVAAQRAHWYSSLAQRWSTVPLRRLLLKLEQGSSPQCDSVPAEAEEWGVLKTSAVTGGAFRSEQNKRLPQGTEPDKRWLIRPGDLLVVRGSGSPAAVGQAAVALPGERRLLLSDLIYRVHLRSANAAFVAEVLRTPQIRAQLESAVRTDAGQTLKVRGDDLRALPVPSAPLPDQLAAVDQIARALAPQQKLIDTIAASVALFQERRQALITAAVTSKIDNPVPA